MLAAVLLTGCQTTPNNPIARANPQDPQNQSGSEAYDEQELTTIISTHLGVTAESAATAIERIFKDSGQPVGYITGEEGGAALAVGVRYGKGTLWMKTGDTQKVYWQGPTIGFDVGGDASKVFTLVYGLKDPDDLFRRFPGIDGSAYLVAGIAVNYQQVDDVTLVPIRSGVGLRLGANAGYTKYSRKRRYLPF